jgi:hypothetical protein
MTSAIIRRLQPEIEAWRQRNYGPCHPWEQLLGCCEEFGEAMEGMGDNAAFGDAISDSAIYLLNFCTSMGWDAATLYEQRDLYEQPSRPWPILVGRLAHHYVKGFVQNYRGTREEHEARAKAAASALFATWEKLCAGMGTTFMDTLQTTWAEVSKRDWTKVRPVPVEVDDNELEAAAVSLPADKQMDKELALDWARGAGVAERVDTVAECIRRAYAHGVLVGRAEVKS